MSLVAGCVFWVGSIGQSLSETPEAELAERAYEQDVRNARAHYIIRLDAALKEAMESEDLEGVHKINATRKRMVAEHLQEGGLELATFEMKGTRSWEESGIRVRKGQTIEINAPGAKVNEDRKETCHGVSAAVGSLLMKVDGRFYALGKGDEVVVEGDGVLFFRSNLKVSPNHTIKLVIVVK